MSLQPDGWVGAGRQLAARHPLVSLLALALLIRVPAGMFSTGFLTHDDHHVAVVAADRIASGAGVASGYQRSVFYPGMVALVMRGARGAGVTSPATEMLLVRFGHALVSLLVVYFAFRILERDATPDAAVLGGLLSAAYFVMPLTAVHQFEEVACQAPLLGACWWATRAERDDRWAIWWGGVAGAALGLALVIRVPLAAFVGPFLLLLVLGRADWRVKVAIMLGFALVVVLQGWSNAVVNGEWWYTFRTRLGVAWRAPIALVTEAEGYPQGPPWHYLLTLAAAFIPPFSLLFLTAIARGGFLLPRLGVSVLSFIVAHSVIANKQERFLLPVVPLLLILGAAGTAGVRNWAASHGWGSVYRGLWSYFWVANAAALAVVMFSPGHHDRVAPLVMIAERRNATGVLVLQFNQEIVIPEYYLGRPRPAVAVVRSRDSLGVHLAALHEAKVVINYVVAYSDSVAGDRVRLECELGVPVTPIATIAPSLTDRLAHAINPRHNKARTAVLLAVETERASDVACP